MLGHALKPQSRMGAPAGPWVRWTGDVQWHWAPQLNLKETLHVNRAPVLLVIVLPVRCDRSIGRCSWDRTTSSSTCATVGSSSSASRSSPTNLRTPSGNDSPNYSLKRSTNYNGHSPFHSPSKCYKTQCFCLQLFIIIIIYYYCYGIRS